MKEKIVRLIEKMYKKLFGETVQKQENRIKKLLYISLALLGVMLLLIFINPQWATAMIAVIFLMWGWRVFCSISGINKISELFHYNVAVIACILLLWITIGYIAGIVCFILGVIRLIQIYYRKKKKNNTLA